MFIHYFIILHGFIVLFSSTLNLQDTINDEDNLNIYGNDDGRYFRNQQEEIDGEYYLPLKKQFKMRDNNELYDDDIYPINADKRYMQNNEELINRNRLFKINSNEKKDLNDYYHILKKQRDRYTNKYLIKQD